MHILPTIEEYKKAKELVTTYYICNGCNNLFHINDLKRTVYYGIEKRWCKDCYEKIKDD